jgi:hypothetical protein
MQGRPLASFILGFRVFPLEHVPARATPSMNKDGPNVLLEPAATERLAVLRPGVLPLHAQ